MLVFSPLPLQKKKGTQLRTHLVPPRCSSLCSRHFAWIYQRLLWELVHDVWSKVHVCVFFWDTTSFQIIGSLSHPKHLTLFPSLFSPAASLVSPTETEAAGTLMVFSLSLGISIGAMSSFGLRAAMCHCNPFESHVVTNSAINTTTVAPIW